MMRNHDRAPSSWCDRGAFYPVFKPMELSAAERDTTLPLYPGVAISLLVMSSNLTGDWLRQRFDPTRRQL